MVRIAPKCDLNFNEKGLPVRTQRT